MKAIKIPVNGDIQIVELSGDGSADFHRACQEQVGSLEIVKPPILYSITMMPHTACMLVDEEGLRKRKPINRIATELHGAHSIVGDVLIVDQIKTTDGYDIIGFGNITAEAVCHIMRNRFKNINKENGGNNNE